MRGRVAAARVLGCAGLACYNWWLGAALRGTPGSSGSGLFSDLEAVGSPEAALFDRLDVAAGLLLLAALLLLDPPPRTGLRAARQLLVVFAVAAAVGGWSPLQCPEGLSAACRAAEWQLRLGWGHYAHIAAGITEFLAGTAAAVVLWRRDRSPPVLPIRCAVVALALGYPLLGVTYLTDRLGAFVEPVFFLSFTATVAVVLFRPGPG
ncbi:MAG TPA: DUF998 domain-containing protein [Kineosporiaceae bacterium]|nr:DUF998 domain-containing protein [Kineosporiaceae bacterium]